MKSRKHSLLLSNAYIHATHSHIHTPAYIHTLGYIHACVQYRDV